MKLLKNASSIAYGKSIDLVVIVHAWMSSSADLVDVREAVRRSLPDADLLIPDYPAGLLSHAQPVQIAELLARKIAQAAQERVSRGSPYREIILIGHSLGALLVRKAYVFARGQTQDSPATIAPAPQSWAAQVSRIILLAGTNRGWSLDRKAANLAWHRWAAFSAGASLWRWLRLARLINSVRRGSPFVANLRVQWLNLERQGPALPPTIQLLGDIDDIVSEDDNVDIESGANFTYLRLDDTGHADSIRFGAGHPQRREKFVYALLTPPNNLQSELERPLEPDRGVEHVIFVMHGIRDYGRWTRSVACMVEKRAAVIGQKLVAIVSSYGFFPMLGFLIQPERQQNVRWFMDQYTEALARYPNARISFISHSNGSYLLASALENYRACSFDRAVLVGSVIKRHFLWDKVVKQRRLKAVRNYVATEDFVVAIFPSFFELLGLSDLGSAGHNGFTDHEGKRHEVAYVKGGHSAALNPSNFDAIAEFILGNNNVYPSPGLIAQHPSGRAIAASRLCWLIWLGLSAFALWPVWYIAWRVGLSGFPNGLTSSEWAVLLWFPFLYALLRTV